MDNMNNQINQHHPDSPYDPEGSYLVFAVNKQYFALPHQHIISILDKPATTMMPGMVEQTCGVMDFMGKPVTLYDFRKILGVPSATEEAEGLFDTLMKRKQDHLNWIAKLKDSVNNCTEITVETNPHNCAFGKWYDSFHTEHIALSRYLKQFDTPHRHVHGIAIQAQHYIKGGNINAAIDLIHETENTVLAKLITLFNGINNVLRNTATECVIVVKADDLSNVAFTVDEPTYFGQLDDISYPLPHMNNSQGSGFTDAYAILNSDGAKTEILIVNLEKLLAETSAGTIRYYDDTHSTQRFARRQSC